MDTGMEIRRISCGQRFLEYQLTRKNVKNVNLRIKADGRILVSANNRVPVKLIDNFVLEKQDFIFKALKKYEERTNVPAKEIVPKQYVSGEKYNILGKSHILNVIEAQQEEVFISPEKMTNEKLEAIEKAATGKY